MLHGGGEGATGEEIAEEDCNTDDREEGRVTNDDCKLKQEETDEEDAVLNEVSSFSISTT